MPVLPRAHPLSALDGCAPVLPHSGGARRGGSGRVSDTTARRRPAAHLRHPTMNFDLGAQVLLLERTPRALRAMLDGLPSEWSGADEGPDTWSPFDIVGHLVHSERANWIPRARMILKDGIAQTFTPLDREAQFRESAGKTLKELLDEFAGLRTDNLATLRSWKLDERQLGLEGLHPEFGRVTLSQLLATWVVHDLGHVAQVARVMAKQYRDAVGPWRAYLPILDR
ncbi:MAG TPA: DinB family protein [Longimicrobium sp.]